MTIYQLSYLIFGHAAGRLHRWITSCILSSMQNYCKIIHARNQTRHSTNRKVTKNANFEQIILWYYQQFHWVLN